MIPELSTINWLMDFPVVLFVMHGNVFNHPASILGLSPYNLYNPLSHPYSTAHSVTRIALPTQ